MDLETFLPLSFSAIRRVAPIAYALSALFFSNTNSQVAFAAEQHQVLLPQEKPNRWSLQLGVGVITENNIGQVFKGEIDSAEDQAAGETYSLSLHWIAHRFSIPFRGSTLNPTFEPYATFTIVNERDDTFPDYNLGAGFRWVDFPWNQWLKTTFFTGIGLSYSSHVLAVDHLRHPGTDRSHLKLDWPLHLTLALPRWPDHQLVLFNDHHSGGHIFDEGGVNILGIGYRFEF
jgi:hypothetical protein